MLLVNRAPIDPVTGKLMVTTATPTPAWPSLGGMTYHPTTGELAVIDAVPAVNDPWNGGIRFTHLGSMYVTTTLPTPIFYVGGIVVSADGRVFFSSSPPLYAVGGWPIAGDGGIAGSGLGPTASFFAPLMTTLVPTTAGNPTFTFARAALAYAMDFEGILRQAISGEARFQGARRVRNWLASSNGFATAAWTKTNSTATAGVVGPTGQLDASTLTITAASGDVFTGASGLPLGTMCVNSIWIRRRTGTGTVVIRNSNNVTVDITSQVDGTWKRFATAPVATTTPILLVGLSAGVIGDAIDIAYAQFEQVDGQSNQAPSEYVSVGVTSSPWHGCGIDGVRCFAVTNGNSVAANVVTEATGTLIPLATTLGYVAENAATNLCRQSQTFDAIEWGKTNATTTPPNTQAAPDGTLTADVFTDDATSGQHVVAMSVTGLTVSQQYTVSVYLKRGTLTWMQLMYWDTTTIFWANFNLLTGAVGNKHASVTSRIEALPNGWYRCSFTFTATNTGNQFQIMGSLTDVAAAQPSYIGTGQTMYLWGAQVEQAAFCSSYVPTTTVAASRVVDSLTYPVATNLDPVTGSFYGEVTIPGTAGIAALDGAVFFVSTNNRALYYTAANKSGSLRGPGGGVATTAFNTWPVPSSPTKAATRWGGASATMAVSVAGSAAVSAASSGTFGADASFKLSSPSAENVYVTRNVSIYATALTDAQLVALTT